MEYGSDYFDKDKNLLPVSEGKDCKDGDMSFCDTDSDYADKTVKKSAPGEDRYDEIFDTTKKNTRAFSVASLILGIASLLCAFVGPLGFILGILSVAAALVSRKILGYFDGICVAGLIVGIFAASFGIGVFLLSIFTDVFDAIKNLF